MKKILCFLIIFVACNNEVAEPALEVIEDTTTIGVDMNNKTYSTEQPMSIDVTKNYTALIKTNFGDIKIEFFTKDAPKTVNNFITLSKDGYYDNVIFHRVISGFMIQGGDPSGTGHGDYGKYPGYEFEDELNNQIPYSKGVLAMANRGPNTNGSQFFIMHVDYPLPYNYTIFGNVVEGIDVVDKIASVDTDSSDRPLEDVIISTVEISES
jgi:cyclophilin family peptidyl-prolyl cis-trans isomerase